MTFPPPGPFGPPGQDPTAQPPPGPPSPPGYTPGQASPVPSPQPTQIDPYQSPDPYAVGGYDPSMPVTAIPGQGAMPPGMPPPGYGYDQYGGYGPPMGPTPPQKNNTGWILGGVAGVVLLVVAIVVTLVATGAFDSEKPPPNANESSSPSEGAPEDETDPTGDTPPSGGVYKYVESLCSDLNLDPYLDGMTTSDPLDLTSEFGDTSLMNCGYSMTSSGGSGAYGYLSISANTYADQAAATEQHPSQKNFSLVDGDPEPLEGPWAEGEIVVVEDSQYGQSDVAVFILDGNLSMRVEFSSTGTPYADSTQDIVLGTVEEIMQLLAS
ncbi:hypothetical protein [Stackebrandtia soli]|uniref:hypothetical protein n=1 Tax=Stackebrandtia soli TaxID=1892856 RepID=UPI0039EB1222